MFRPPRLDGATQQFATFLGANITPPRRSQADRRSLNRRRRKLAARDVEQLNRQIHQNFRGKSGVFDDRFQSIRAPHAEGLGEIGRNCLGWLISCWILHTNACINSCKLSSCRVEVHMSGRLAHRYGPLLLSVAAILLAPTLAFAQSPWERAANNLALTFAGPLARSLALVSIVIGGLLFMFGEAGAKRQISGIVFGGGLALFAAQFLTWLF